MQPSVGVVRSLVDGAVGVDVGSEGELEEFLEREYPRVFAAVALYCGDRNVAEDLAQEAMARVCRDWSRVRGMDAPGAWAHRTAINLAKSRWRRSAAARRAMDRVGIPNEAVDADPTDAIVVRDAIAELSDRHREAVVLYYLLGHTVGEVAHAMRTREGTVKSWLSRARHVLRGSLAAADREVSDERH